MAAPDSTAAEDVPSQAFPFLSLPVEIRHLIYHEVFSHRSIILRDHLTPAGTYICGRRYWNFHLDDPEGTSDSTIPLLQVSKQVLAEAYPLLSAYPPSHLILSKDLHNLPGKFDCKDLEHKIGLPMKHITHLTLNVKSLGENKSLPRVCPGPPISFPGQPEFGFLDGGSIWCFDGFNESETPPPDPERLPNLENFHTLSSFLNNALPALREVHVYDVLKHNLSRPPDPCTCPIAGSESCTCGDCQCYCITQPPLPQSVPMSLSDTQAKLWEALRSRFQTALPISEERRPSADYNTLFKLLEDGIHVFLHEEIGLTVPLNSDSVLSKGLWRATYHLAPLGIAKVPAKPPSTAIESPRQRKSRQKRKEKAAAERNLRSGKDVEWKDDCSDLPSDVPSVFDFSAHLDDDLYRKHSVQSGVGKPLVEFEAGLRLEIADESMFDRILDRTLVEGRGQLGWAEERYGQLWQWD